MHLKIGRKFTLPASLAQQTTAVLGIRGSGKTVTASVCVEELLDQNQQVCVIDPTDVWFGLKSSADGKKPGYPVLILGGDHGDLPLVETDGATVARFVVEERASVIISLRHLRKAAQRRFVTDFCEQLYHLKGKAANRNSLLLVIDECDLYVPQRVGGAEARMVGAVEDLVRRGRAAGIGVLLISQRAASINKDVLTQLETLVAHRHTSPQDRKALLEWVKAHDSDSKQEMFMTSLASLVQGEAWFWSPLLDIFSRVQVRNRNTFDSSATPKPGKVVTPKNAATVDIEKWRARLGEIIERKKTEDPQALKKRIADLENQLKLKSAAPDKSDVVREREEERVALMMANCRKEISRGLELLQQVGPRLEEALSFMRTQPAEPASSRRRAIAPIPSAARLPQVSRPRAETVVAPDRLDRCARSIYSFLLSNAASSWTREQIALMTGYSHSSGSFSNALSALRTRCLIVESAGRYAGVVAEPYSQDVEELSFSVSNIEAKLGKCEREIFQLAMTGNWDVLDKAALADMTPSRYSATSGSFDNAISRLCTLGVMERAPGGRVSKSKHFQELL